MLAVARLPGGATAVLADLKRWSRSATGRAAALFAVVAGAYVVGAELAWHHFSSGLAFGYPPSGVDVAALGQEAQEPFLCLWNSVRSRDRHDVEAVRAGGFDQGRLEAWGQACGRLVQKSRSA